MLSPLVLVIRESDGFSEKLRESGCRTVNLPLTRTETVTDLSDLGLKIAAIDEYDGIFLTSPAAAELFVSNARGIDLRAKIYALGDRARAVLQNAGFRAEPNGEANTAREMIEFFGNDEFAGKRYLFVRGERSMRTIPSMLDGIASVDETVVYRTIEIPAGTDDLPVDGEIGWVCFFSPSGVEAFVKSFDHIRFAGMQAAAIGTTTAEAAAKAGFNVGFISPIANAEAFAEGLIGHIKSFE